MLLELVNYLFIIVESQRTEENPLFLNLKVKQYSLSQNPVTTVHSNDPYFPIYISVERNW